MKLSELTAYLERLESFTPTHLRAAHDRDWQQFMSNVCCYPDLDQFDQRLAQDCAQLNLAFDQLEQTFQALTQSIQTRMRPLQEQVRISNQTWWEQGEYQFSQNLDCLQRRANFSRQQVDLLKAAVRKVQDWRWPAMIVRPGLESLIDDMVSFDPLYLVDITLDLLKPALDRFPIQYQNRLCCYTVDERSAEPMLASLPHSQLALCFAFYYFNFRPLDVIVRWMQEVWHLLRPGGRMLFTYNDCDRVTGVMNSEINWMAYTSGSEIRTQALALGFDIIEQHSDDAMSWIHLGKPGQLESLRGSQTLAKIVTRPK